MTEGSTQNAMALRVHEAGQARPKPSRARSTEEAMEMRPRHALARRLPRNVFGPVKGRPGEKRAMDQQFGCGWWRHVVVAVDQGQHVYPRRSDAVRCGCSEATVAAGRGPSPLMRE